MAFVRAALRTLVLLLVAAVAAVTVAQQIGSDGPWWLELSRYLPYPLLLAPALLAVLLALPLGWRWIAAAAASVAAVVVVVMGLQWHWRDDAASTFRLVSYNAKAALALERPGGVQALIREVATQHADILVMQDAGGLRQWRAEDKAALLAGLPQVFAEGQYLVASRFPLRCASAQVDTGGEPLAYVRCSVERDGAAFELITVHFESPRSGLVAARREGFDGIEPWRRNHEARLAQSRALARAIGTTTRPLIVAGDLNAPDSSAVVGSLRAIGLRDAFASAGRGWGYTYGHTLRPAFSFLRIDHILVGAGIEARECFVGGAAASDHRPVIADLVLAAPAGG
ncbi:MAG: endonuclease/exonuclease/phosphatase family protein [Pseudomonadota bacterium]|nr:endonuclease/exonuclease/phosphatase family protein [Pseudomonadota bacterium]